ncbi:MAG: TonB-dependent receptor [Muribaculaceae bacterium]|nr:TonB-dependent receptor [Muribaculaceae bacterium]
MKERIVTLLTAATLTSGLAMAKIYTGTVLNEADGEPLIGATVSVKGTSVVVATDIDGNYRIDIPEKGKTLVVNYIGMVPQELPVRSLDERDQLIRLAEKSNALNEVVVTGMGARKKITVTGAVTNVDVDDMKHFSTSNLSNALAGNVPGIMARQTSGQPGKNKSEFWIRGISTFGAGTGAYILVDGFERESIDDLNIEDIETFTVLKDASATAIYGSKGANGVVLITTKHGKAGKVNVSAKFETSYNARTNTPDFVDGLTYASLLNEASVTRSNGVYFTPTELELFRNGLDPDLYPNVDWKDLILKDGAMSYRANVNISGGGNTARYYASMSYVNDEGMYKTDSNLREKYNTNANYSRWNYRLNLDIDLSSTTLLRIGTSGDLSMRNSPGMGDTDTWNSLFGYNAILTPIMYSNGYVPMVNMNRDDLRTNPWVMTTQTGYKQEWNNNLQNNLSLEQDLKFVTPGLKFTGRLGYDTYNYNWINHLQQPDRWYANGRDKETGEIIFDKIKDRQDMVQSSGNEGSRRIFIDLLLSYNREFGKHHVGANLKYTYDNDLKTQNIGSDIKNGVARKNMALAGQVLYNWDYRYFVDFNFGYNGSENFADGHRFGFFPAASAGWNLKREAFLKDVNWIDQLKIRYSYGKVGNDKIYEGNNLIRFPYLYSIDYVRDSEGDPKNVWNFGTLNSPTRPAYQQGLHYSALASNNVTWEVATKQDVGLDIGLFHNTFSMTVDYFHEKRTGIYMKREFLPGTMGLEQSPWANVGAVKSEGVDGHFRYENRFGDVTLTVRGNMTYSKNTILDYDVENNVYPYQYQTGYRVDQVRGLVAEGLFADYDDIRNSPKQMFGDVQPGDIKYKDVNGDGIVDDNDVVAIGATSRPNLTYGVGASVMWKGFDFNVHFQGAGKSSVLINGKTVWAFSQDRYGQILADLVDDRWVDSETAAQLGIPANENPNASYPRLVYLQGNAGHNNYRASSYWMRDMSYVRLKNLEFGYSLPKDLLSRIHFENVRFFLQGANLLTFSSFKLWDPEMGSENGEKYPLTRSVTLGVQINL